MTLFAIAVETAPSDRLAVGLAISASTGELLCCHSLIYASLKDFVGDLHLILQEHEEQSDETRITIKYTNAVDVSELLSVLKSKYN